MESIDLNGGTLLAAYSLPPSVGRDLIRHIGRVTFEGGTPRQTRLNRVASGLVLSVLAGVLFALFGFPRWGLADRDGLKIGFLMGVIAVAAVAIVVCARQVFAGKEVFARAFDANTISVKLHDLGISWALPQSYTYLRFESFDRVSNFNGGLVLHAGLGAVFVPAEFLTAMLGERTVQDTIRAKLPHLDWRRIQMAGDAK